MKLKEGQKLRVKEFNERPSHWEKYGKMNKWMGKIVTFKRYYASYKDILIFEDENSGGWHWKESDFQIVFDTWENVNKAIEAECDKHIGCGNCPLSNESYCYSEYLENENCKQLAENFKKMFGMECYVLEDEKMKNGFRLSDLKDEMVLVNREGDKYVVLGENFIGEDNFDRKGNYKENMKNIAFNNLDIVEVYNPSKRYGNGLLELLKIVGEPIWKEEPITRDVSIEEINSLLKEKYPDVEKFNLPIDNNK